MRQQQSIMEPAVLRRQVDMQRLMRLLRAIDWPLVVRAARNLPFEVEHELLVFHDIFLRIVEEKRSHFFDPELETRFQAVRDLWSQIYSYARFSGMGRNGELSYCDLSPAARQEQDWRGIEACAKKFISTIALLLTDVAERFPEIDVARITSIRRKCAIL